MTHKISNRRNRRGLTLIELLLVLLILIAVASILVPLFGNVIGLAHSSSSAANVEEITRNFENHKAMFAGYPNQLDLLLTDSTSTAQSAIAPFGQDGDIAATELAVFGATGRMIDALAEAGITEVIQNPVEADLLDEEDFTNFGPVGVGGSRIIALDEAGPTPGNFVILGLDAITRLGLTPDETSAGSTAEGAPFAYVALGVGNNNDGVGKSMVTAPVHFLSDGGSNEEVYARFFAIFRIPGEEGAAILSNVATIDVHDGEAEVVGLGGHIREYYHTKEQ